MNSQTLLCISFLVLLLLPLSLSCDSKRPLREVRDDWLFVETLLSHAYERIATLLQNTSCPVLKHKLRNCTSDNAEPQYRVEESYTSTIAWHLLLMLDTSLVEEWDGVPFFHQHLSQVSQHGCVGHSSANSMPNQDIVSPLHFLTCKMKTLSIPHTDGLVKSVLGSLRCPCSEKPTKDPNVRSKRRVTRQRRNEQKLLKKGTKKLCKAKALLSAMTTCYQMLNTITMDT